jgi:hypothetical protein
VRIGHPHPIQKSVDFVFNLGDNIFMLKILLTAAVTLALTACGGGGSGGTNSPQQPTSPTTTAQSSKYFDAAVELPDLSSYYPAGCNAPFVSLVNAVDLRHAGGQDLVVHVWCNEPAGTSPTHHTLNSLIVLLRQLSGQYTIGNQTIFGTSIVDLGGASRNVVIADFNGDGYSDLAYAINLEDGRNGSMNAQLAVMMSNGNGTYRVDRIGTPDWFHAITAVDNNVGGKDIVATGLTNSGTQAYRYINSAWTNVSANYLASLSGLTFGFLNSTTGFTGGTSPADLDSTTLVGGVWNTSTLLSYPATTVPILTWNGTTQNVASIAVGNTRISGAGFDQACTLKVTPSGTAIPVVKLDGRVIPANYDGVSTLVETAQPTYLNMIAVGAPNLFAGIDTTIQYNFFDCVDKSSDGYDDFIAYPARVGGIPEVFLNNKAGNLVRFNTSDFPKALDTQGISRALYADLDGDGKPDLLYWSVNNVHNKFVVYKGTQPLVP